MEPTTHLPFLDNPDNHALLFVPEKTARSFTGLTPSFTITVGVSAEVQLNCPFFKAENDGPVMFYFPPTSEGIEDLGEMIAAYNNQGIHVVLVTYRGYADNSGQPAFSTIFADCRAVVEQSIDALKEAGIEQPVFLMGNTVGAAVVIDLVAAGIGDAKAMILENGICDTADFLKNLGASAELTEFNESDGFNLASRIEAIKLPTLIFHGARDQRTSIAQAEQLQAASGARTKQFFVIPGANHDNLHKMAGPLYYETIKKFMDTLCGVNTWRQRRKRFKKQDGESNP